MKLRKKRSPKRTAEHTTCEIDECDAHGLTVVVCLCGWERSLSSPDRARALADEHVALHAR